MNKILFMNMNTVRRWYLRTHTGMIISISVTVYTVASVSAGTLRVTITECEFGAVEENKLFPNCYLFLIPNPTMIYKQQRVSNA